MHRCFSLVSSAVLVCLLFACGAEPPQPLEVGSPLPSFKLKALDGSRVTAKSLEGRPAVINFWATWCQPCLKEIPDLKTLAEEDGVQVVGIALDEEGRSVVEPFAEERGMSYTILLGDKEVFRRFDGFGIPYTLVVDARQRVVSLYRGVASLEDLRDDLRGLAAQSFLDSP